jgi:hypothetical protein
MRFSMYTYILLGPEKIPSNLASFINLRITMTIYK